MTNQPPPYDPNVPNNPFSSLAATQPEFLNDFLQLYNVFKVNHIPLDNSTVPGNHTFIELVEQQVPAQTDVDEISVYTKGVPDQTDQIFIRYQGNGQEFQYTNYQIYSIEPQNGVTTFFTFLPGGLLLLFGSFTDLPKNILNLYPPVAKNIITVSMCPMKATTDFNFNTKPQVSLEPAVKGRYTKMIVRSALGGEVAMKAPDSFYAILANV